MISMWRSRCLFAAEEVQQWGGTFPAVFLTPSVRSRYSRRNDKNFKEMMGRMWCLSRHT